MTKQAPRYVWNDPNGAWVIQHTGRGYFYDDRNSASFGTLGSHTLRYHTQEDAEYIAAGLVERRSICGGVSCVDQEGNSQLSIVHLESNVP